MTETWKAAGEAAVADAVPLDMNGYKLHRVKGILTAPSNPWPDGTDE